MTIQDQIALLRKREAICWDMLGVFLDARANQMDLFLS